MKRQRLRPITVLLLVAALASTACGSRRDLDELVAAASSDVTAPAGEAATGATGDLAVGETVVDVAPGADPAGGGTVGGAGGATGGPAGGTTGGATGGTTGGSPGGSRTANKSEVVLGVVSTISGPVGAFVKDSVTAIQVWQQHINSRGGLNGHPVRVIVADDGGDPSRYLALQRQLVEQQGAIGMIFNTLGFGAAGNTSYNEQNRIPVIGHEGGTEFSYSSPMVFTAASSGNNYAFSLINGLADVVKPKGVKKIAVLACSDVKLCDIFFKNWTGEGAQRNGFDVVYTARPSLTQPDYTAECLAAKQAGAEAIIAAIDNNSYIRLGNSCNRQSYKPIIGIADQLALPSVAQADSLQGSVVAGRLAAWPANDQPGLKEVKEAFARFAPGTEINGAHIGGWLYAQVVAEAGRSFPDKPTNEDLLQGLWSIKDNTFGGLTYPVTFTEGQSSVRKTCWTSVVIEGKKFTAPFGGRLQCL